MLAPGTPILTLNGYTPIARVRAGDTVLSLGGDLSRSQPGRVMMAAESLHETLLKLAVGTVLLYAAPELKVRCRAGWIELADLSIGDPVLCCGTDNELRWIESGRRSKVVTGPNQALWKVWTLDIEAAQPYVANGVVVM